MKKKLKDSWLGHWNWSVSSGGGQVINHYAYKMYVEEGECYDPPVKPRVETAYNNYPSWN